MAGNGHNDQESRLARLEAFAELAIRDNEEFRERFRLMQAAQERMQQSQEWIVEAHEDFEREHKLLLKAQVVMQDSLQKLDLTVKEIGDKLNGLIDWSEKVNQEHHDRFKRLEEKH